MTSKKVIASTFLILTGTIAVAIFALSFRTNPLHASGYCDNSAEMVLVKGDTFTIGANPVYVEEQPLAGVKVDDFYISRYEVTNREFSEFVDATDYKTVAERQIDASLYPNIDPKLLVPGSAVFIQPSEFAETIDYMSWWQFIEGANWRHPQGPQSDIQGKENMPVVHIALEDAMAYAKWKGHRLPTEAEFEFASRGGVKRKPGSTDDELFINGEHQANTWQGEFPFENSAEDGSVGVSEVGCYPANELGIHDMIGNVWEWTNSPFFATHEITTQVPEDYAGYGYDNSQPGIPVGVIKGGSYLCAPDFCMRYRPAARHAQDTGLGTSHIGFRTVKDAS